MGIKINIPSNRQSDLAGITSFEFTVTNFERIKEDWQSAGIDLSFVDFDDVESRLKNPYFATAIMDDKLIALKTQNVTFTETITGQFMDAITSAEITSSLDQSNISVSILSSNYTSIDIEITTNGVDQDYTISLFSQGTQKDYPFQVLTLSGNGTAGTTSEDFSGGSLGIWSDTGSNSWTFGTDTTPSTGTGPNILPTGSTAMIFAETSGTVPGNTHIIETTDFAVATSISYKYHMHGNTMGALRLQYSQDDGVNWTDIDVFIGQQQVNQTDDYIEKTTDLSIYAINKLRFLYTDATTFRADCCITDINLTSV